MIVKQYALYFKNILSKFSDSFTTWTHYLNSVRIVKNEVGGSTKVMVQVSVGEGEWLRGQIPKKA